MIKQGLLEELRKSKGLTLLQMGNKLDVSHMTYQRYEKGDTDVSTDMLCKIADIFTVSTDYLLGRTTIKEPAFSDPLTAMGIDTDEIYTVPEFQKAYDELSEPMQALVRLSVKGFVQFLKAKNEAGAAEQADLLQQTDPEHPGADKEQSATTEPASPYAVSVGRAGIKKPPAAGGASPFVGGKSPAATAAELAVSPAVKGDLAVSADKPTAGRKMAMRGARVTPKGGKK